MAECPESPETGSISNEAEVATGIRGLRILARIIARDLTNSQRNVSEDNGTIENEPRNRLTNDKGLR